jgi:tryptophan synthase alpha chain
MHGMVEAGADVIELGVPFSDPSADGPVIQKAGDRALALGIGLVQVLAMVRDLPRAQRTTPVVLMGYANPVERYDQKHGAGALCATPAPPAWTACWSWTTRPRNARTLPPPARAQHGPDLPAGAHLHRRAHGAGGPRGQRLCVLRVAQGRDRRRHAGRGQVEAMLPRIRAHVSVPVGVGFGIRDAETAKAIGKLADAVVIGSKIIQLIENEPHEKVVPWPPTFLRTIRKALDA